MLYVVLLHNSNGTRNGRCIWCVSDFRMRKWGGLASDWNLRTKFEVDVRPPKAPEMKCSTTEFHEVQPQRRENNRDSRNSCGHVMRLVGVLQQDIIHIPVSTSLRKYLCAQSISSIIASPM